MYIVGIAGEEKKKNSLRFLPCVGKHNSSYSPPTLLGDRAVKNIETELYTGASIQNEVSEREMEKAAGF